MFLFKPFYLSFFAFDYFKLSKVYVLVILCCPKIRLDKCIYLKLNLASQMILISWVVNRVKEAHTHTQCTCTLNVWVVRLTHSYQFVCEANFNILTALFNNHHRICALIRWLNDLLTIIQVYLFIQHYDTQNVYVQTL